VNKADGTWQVYRSKFLIQAKQLAEPLSFVDALGREQRGDKGDYLVDSNGILRIWPQALFESAYALLDPAPCPLLMSMAEPHNRLAHSAPLPRRTGAGKLPPGRCGKAVPESGTRAVNCLRYNI
jgi:hypothetical protein